MNDRIYKFRAWHKKAKEMFYNWAGWFLTLDGDFQEFIEGEPKDSILSIRYCNKSIIDDVELMQFTGLLDRKGVEIYESDVVKVRGENAIVEYSGSCFVFVIGNREVYVDSENETCEVIGNRYENPELLTNK